MTSTSDGITVRSFESGTIAELARPVSALEFSATHVARNAAYTSDEKGDAMAVGRLKQVQTAQGPRKGGGWKARSYPV
jgi:hypothetical protein